MAYTICDMHGEPKPLRLLIANAQDDVRTGDSFTPFWWRCDPCNPASKRYEITFRADQDAQAYAWYQVITSDDDQRTIDCKIAHYVKVIAARKAADDAHRQWVLLSS